MATYKHMTCNYWARGDCRYTEAECRYAHSWTDQTSNERYVPRGARVASVSVFAPRPLRQPTPTSTASNQAGPRFQASIPVTRAMHQPTTSSTAIDPAGSRFQPSVPVARPMHQPAANSMVSGLAGPSTQAFVPVTRIMQRPTATSTTSSLAGASFRAFGPVPRATELSAPISKTSNLARPSLSDTTSTRTSDSGHGVALDPSSANNRKGKGVARHPPPTTQPTSNQRPSLNPYAPKFEPLLANRRGLYLNPNAAKSDPSLGAPTDSVNISVEAKNKVSQIFDNEPSEIWHMAEDMMKLTREIESGQRSGRANAESILKGVKINLTGYAAYSKWLATTMSEASKAFVPSEKKQW